jgi:ribosome-associated heat shock protein Hsp15
MDEMRHGMPVDERRSLLQPRKCRAVVDLGLRPLIRSRGLGFCRGAATFAPMDAIEDKTRVDKWLWAARFYKTRSLAAEAVAGGKVQVNGERVKRAKPLQVGDEIRVRQGPYEYHVVVRELSSQRGPAARALQLYEEMPASRAAREAMALQLKSIHSAFVPDRGRPTKKDRREINRLKGRER